MKLLTEGTQQEQELLVKALCYRFNYSDTKTIKHEVVTPTENEEGVMEDVITYEEEIVANISPEKFATKEISKLLAHFVDDFLKIQAQTEEQEKQKLLDDEINKKVENSKITFE